MVENKKATVNRKNNDEKFFQFALTVALNDQNIKNNPERITKIKPCINQYNWKKQDLPSHKKDLKKCKSNNKSIALNVLHVPYNTEEIIHACKSKNNK